MTADNGTTARAVADAAAGVPGVVRLTGGGGAVIAVTHYPGGTVTGVRLTPDEVWVHIVVGMLPLVPVTEQVLRAVRTALDQLGDSRRVEVLVEDLDQSALGALPGGGGAQP